MKILVVNPNTLYDLYEITRDSDAPDLSSVGMAMLREQNPTITDKEAEELRQFTGRHGQALAQVFNEGTEQDFVQKVAELIIEDIQEAKELEEAEKAEDAEDAEEGGEA